MGYDINESLQDLAKSAKKRMKQGYWSNIIEARRKDIDKATRKGISESNVISYYRDKVLRDFYVSSERVERDERMYRKVVNMLTSDEIIINPLARLIEHEYYDNLNEDDKVAYMFDLSRRYLKCKERFEDSGKSTY